MNCSLLPGAKLPGEGFDQAVSVLLDKAACHLIKMIVVTVCDRLFSLHGVMLGVFMCLNRFLHLAKLGNINQVES